MSSSADPMERAVRLYAEARGLYRDGKSGDAIELYLDAAELILSLPLTDERVSNLSQISTELRNCGTLTSAISLLDAFAPKLLSYEGLNLAVSSKVDPLTLLLYFRCVQPEQQSQNIWENNIWRLLQLVISLSPSQLENEKWVVSTIWTALYLYRMGVNTMYEHSMYGSINQVARNSWLLERHPYIWETIEGVAVVRRPPFYNPDEDQTRTQKSAELQKESEKRSGSGKNSSLPYQPRSAEDGGKLKSKMLQRPQSYTANKALPWPASGSNPTNPPVDLQATQPRKETRLGEPYQQDADKSAEYRNKEYVSKLMQTYRMTGQGFMKAENMGKSTSVNHSKPYDRPGSHETVVNNQTTEGATNTTPGKQHLPFRDKDNTKYGSGYSGPPEDAEKSAEYRSKEYESKLMQTYRMTGQGFMKAEYIKKSTSANHSKPYDRPGSHETVVNNQTTEGVANTTPGKQHLPFRDKDNTKYGSSYSGPPETFDRVSSIADRWFEEDLELRCHPIVRDPAYATTDSSKHSRIKVAVLDTGIAKTKASGRPDLVDDYLDRIIDCRTFEGDADGRPDSTDEDGHGTHVAMLVLKTFPNADLYIAKVATRGDYIKRENVVKALRWAINSNVDVINMSFGWEHVDMGEMSDLLGEAERKHILLFAATSNDGLRKEGGMAYPASSDKVIGIDCANGAGVSTQVFNPPSTSRNNAKWRFTAPGERVQSAYPTKHAPSGLKRMDGTSFASPVAAGIAAMVLDFAQQEPLSYEPAIFAALKRREVMLWVFHDLLSEKIEETLPFRFLIPRKLWEAGRREDGSYIVGQAMEAGAPRRLAAEKIVQCLRSRSMPALGTTFYERLNRR